MWHCNSTPFDKLMNVAKLKKTVPICYGNLHSVAMNLHWSITWTWWGFKGHSESTPWRNLFISAASTMTLTLHAASSAETQFQLMKAYAAETSWFNLTLCYVRCSRSSPFALVHVAMSLYNIINHNWVSITVLHTSMLGLPCMNA